MFWKLTNDNILLLLLRVVFITYILIVVPLVITDLRLGGRYLILLEALIIAFSAQTIRNYIGNKLSYRERSILTALSSIIILGLFKSILISVNLTITGILILYSGAVLLEVILPNRLVKNKW